MLADFDLHNGFGDRSAECNALVVHTEFLPSSQQCAHLVPCLRLVRAGSMRHHRMPEIHSILREFG